MNPFENPSIHHIASDVTLGKNVRIGPFVNLYGCVIGDESKLGSFVEIQKNARIGTHCKIQSHTFICEGVTLEEGVFVGHHVCFINDKYPKAVNFDGSLQTEKDWRLSPTHVKKNASIGSGCTILCGITLGEGCLVGAGSVVTKDVPDFEIWAGNPARFIKKSNPSK